MGLKGRKSFEEKTNRNLFSISILLLVLFLLLSASQATAEPVIIEDEGCGSWCDNFVDRDGIETWENMIIEEGEVRLLPVENLTRWVKKGIAVENGGRYDLFFAQSPKIWKEERIYKM